MLDLHAANVPYITNDALELYAEDIIRDFKPDLLKYPQSIEVDNFLEFYLGLQVEYKRLTRENRLLGMTIFDDGIIQVFNEYTGKAEFLRVSEGTVLIDISLTSKRNENRRRFTCMHEGSHWLLHRHSFPKDKWNNEYMVSRKIQTDNSMSRRERESIRRMERQADYLAAAILIPKTTLRMLFRDFCKEWDIIPPRKIIRGDGGLAFMLAELTAERYGVSHKAATIRLEKLGAIAGVP